MAEKRIVAVTGGAGFIGSHTVDGLLSAGCHVVVLDNFSTGRRSNLADWRDHERLRVLEVDVADGLFAPLAPIESEWGPVRWLIHLAAQTSVVYSIDNPLFDVRNNLSSTVQVLDYARRRRAEKVVFASSAAVYGDVHLLPVSEESPCRPLSPYGVDKLSSEHFLRYQSSVHGLATTPLRFFNVYGPRQDPSSPYSGVISIFADRAGRGEPLTIFGDGLQTRDFVYVGDVSRAIVSACFTAGGDGAPVNIGTGKRTTVRELAETINGLCGGASEIGHAAPREGEIRDSVAKVEVARARLGFAAETELPQGLARTLESLEQ